MKEFIIGRNDAGQRLDRFVSKAAPLIPESLLQKTLRKKDIKINGRPAKGEARLAEGDTVRVYLPDEFFEAPREENAWRKITAPRLDIVYEDENILLVDKSRASSATARGSGAGIRSSPISRRISARRASGIRRGRTALRLRSATASTAIPAAS